MSPLFKWCQLPFIEPKKKGAFATVAKKLIMEERCKVTGEALRIEKALYWTDEGKSSLDCPIAKSTIRRKKQVEKYLVITKDRNNHKCKYKQIVISIVAWEGLQFEFADKAYDDMSGILGKFGNPTLR